MVAATPAHAAIHKDIAYAVSYEGAGKYQKIDRSDHGEDWTEEEVNLQFTFSGEINDGVVFRDGHPFDKSGDDLGESTIAGDIQYRGSGGGLTCPVMADKSWATGWMRLMEDPDEVVPLDGETHLWIRPFDQFIADFDCGGSFPGASLTTFDTLDEDGYAKAGTHTFDTPFSLPREVFGMGYVEQLIPLQVVDGERCPGRLYDTTTCRLEWSGKVIFRKLWEKTVKIDPPAAPAPAPKSDDDDFLVPLVPPAPKPAPKPPADEDDWLVPLVQQSSAKVDASGSSASVTVTCATGCSGDIELVPLTTGGARAAAKPKAIAKARFRVPAGKPTKVRLKLGREARRALRRTRRAQLRLTFARPVRRTQTIAVRLPRR